MSDSSKFTETAGETAPEHADPDVDIPLYQLVFWISALLALVAILSGFGIER